MDVIKSDQATVDVEEFEARGIVVIDRCPHCDEVMSQDLQYFPLSMPVRCSEPQTYEFFCTECNAEWTRQLQVEVTIKPCT